MNVNISTKRALQFQFHIQPSKRKTLRWTTFDHKYFRVQLHILRTRKSCGLLGINVSMLFFMVNARCGLHGSW